MKLITPFILLFLLSIQFGYSQTEDCCPNFRIYGDETDNFPTRIKHFDGFTYILGTTQSNNQKVATFTKLKLNSEVVWEFQLDFQSELFDFVKTDDKAFLLVGRTLPAQSDNRSILAKITDDGVQDFIRTYNNNSREALVRIVKHPNPVNANAPYYVAGYENPPGGVTYLDEVHLRNLDANGNIKWSKEFTAASDDQWARDMIPLSDGNLLLVGDYLPSGRGVVVKVSGTDGSAIDAINTTPNSSYYAGVEDSKGNIILAGRYNATSSTNTQVGVLALFDKDLNHISSTISSDGEFDILRELKIDSEDNVYCAGISTNNFPLICKAKVNSTTNTIDIIDAKYFRKDGTDFISPLIDVVGSRLFYTEARYDHPLSFGGFDILTGFFDLDLNDICLKETELATKFLDLDVIGMTVFEENINTPNASQLIDLVKQSMDNESLCFIIDGINENIITTGISIYPNVTSDWINIESETPFIGISIYSLDGKLIQDQRITRPVNNLNVELKGAHAGVYILRINHSNSFISSHRIIKE